MFSYISVPSCNWHNIRCCQLVSKSATDMFPSGDEEGVTHKVYHYCFVSMILFIYFLVWVYVYWLSMAYNDICNNNNNNNFFF